MPPHAPIHGPTSLPSLDSRWPRAGRCVRSPLVLPCGLRRRGRRRRPPARWRWWRTSTPLPPSSDPFDYRYSEVAARGRHRLPGRGRRGGRADHGRGRGAEHRRARRRARPIHQQRRGRGRSAGLRRPASRRRGLRHLQRPGPPSRRAQRSDPVSYCHTVFIHGDIVYCSTSSSSDPHLAFYRVVTPADPGGAPARSRRPAATATRYTPEEEQRDADIIVHDVFVHERDGRTLAYLAYWERGLQIVDVTDPARPQLVGASAPTPTRWTHSVWVDGDFAYVGEESYKGLVRVFDVSNPAAPVEVGQLRSTEGDAISAHNLQVANGVLYASWYQDGLRAFAAPGRAAPAEVGYFHTWNGADNRANPGPTGRALRRQLGRVRRRRPDLRLGHADRAVGAAATQQPAAATCPPDRPAGHQRLRQGRDARPSAGAASSRAACARPGRSPCWRGADLGRSLLRSHRRDGARPAPAPPAQRRARGRRRPRCCPDRRRRSAPLPVRDRLAAPGRGSGRRPGCSASSASWTTRATSAACSGRSRCCRRRRPTGTSSPTTIRGCRACCGSIGSNRATASGTLTGGDRRDLVPPRPAPGAPALRLRLVTGAIAGAPEQPSALLLGRPVDLPASRTSARRSARPSPIPLSQTLAGSRRSRCPAGEAGTIYVTIETPPISRRSAALLLYRLEIAAP